MRVIRAFTGGGSTGLVVLATILVATLSVSVAVAADAFGSAPEEDVEALKASTDAGSQQDLALADGVVTVAEHEAAIVVWIQCVSDRGGNPTVFPGDGLRPTSAAFEFVDPDGDPDAETARAGYAAMTECRQEHLDAVDSAWAGQVAQPREGAPLQALFDRMEECMVTDAAADYPFSGEAVSYAPYAPSAGFPIMSISADEAFAYMRCAFAEQAATGFRAPLPTIEGETPRPGWLTPP